MLRIVPVRFAPQFDNRLGQMPVIHPLAVNEIVTRQIPGRCQINQFIPTYRSILVVADGVVPFRIAFHEYILKSDGDWTKSHKTRRLEQVRSPLDRSIPIQETTDLSAVRSYCVAKHLFISPPTKQIDFAVDDSGNRYECGITLGNLSV